MNEALIRECIEWVGMVGADNPEKVGVVTIVLSQYLQGLKDMYRECPEGEDYLEEEAQAEWEEDLKNPKTRRHLQRYGLLK